MEKCDPAKCRDCELKLYNEDLEEECENLSEQVRELIEDVKRMRSELDEIKDRNAEIMNGVRRIGSEAIEMIQMFGGDD